uniref:TOG domain-containing protein n=1 Tax=Candidozyma auris TaxID=498019 RepID=A0A0L0NUD4_CANAR
MADEEDYSNLPIGEKIVHKVWKVRQDGYTTLNEEFAKSRSPEDQCFSIFNQRPETVKQIVTDSNVVAQETGIQAVCFFFEYGGTSANASKLLNAGLVTSLCEKGLSSSRAGTKSKTVEALLRMVEHLNSGDQVIEQIIPFFDHRLPKLVAASVNAVYTIIEQFGCQVASPKPVIPKLAKLFSHADKNVRAQTTTLTVELYKWMGQGLTLVLMDNLRPVQQKDLQADFDKVSGEKPEQKRYTKQQQEKLAEQQRANEREDVDMDVDNSEVKGADPASQEFDPHEMLEPVDVLLKLPSDLSSRMASAKWKDRKEALDEVYAVLSKAPKLVNADYTDLVRLFAKCMKDANIQVVQLAANGVEFLSKGLKQGFHKYQHIVLGPMIDRNKEKKPSVADALANALDAIFDSSSLGDVLDETIIGMRHKTPQVKISATEFLRRCLSKTTTAPRRPQIDIIMEVGVKLLSESQEPIRQAGTDMIGTLMKITGERELVGFLEKVDENRMAMVRAAYEKAEVKCKTSVGTLPQRSMSARTAATTTKKLASVPLLRKTEPVSSQAIPSKRGATSPAKKAEATKLPSSVRSLTGRLLVSPSTRINSSASKPESFSKGPLMGAEELQELETLRKEKLELLSQTNKLAELQLNWEREREQYHEQIKHLQSQVDNLQDENANKRQVLVDKDAEILHWKNEAGNAKLKILSMEQVITMLKLNQNGASTDLIEERRSDSPQPLFSPTRTVEVQAELSGRGSQSELSSRVNRLSIDGRETQRGASQSPGTQESNITSPVRSEGYRRTSNYSTSRSKESDSEEDNWKKAAEVTAQLKARIEKMKQRNRISMNRP